MSHPAISRQHSMMNLHEIPDIEKGHGHSLSPPLPESHSHSQASTSQRCPSRSESICVPTRKGKERQRERSWSTWANEDIQTCHLVPSLVVQAFATGILDATTYADFHTFASNQTGNTILLTVSVIGTMEILLLLTGVSLASFLLGAFFFGHLGHFFGIRRRAWILTTTLIQIILLLTACILLSPAGPHTTNITGTHQWLPLALFAHMSGAQVASARQSGSAELPTAPMTSSFVDLVSDQYLFKSFRHPNAGPRNRRLAYVVAMISGGFLGAVIHRFAGSWVVVVVTMVLKGVAGVLVAVAVGE